MLTATPGSTPSPADAEQRQARLLAALAHATTHLLHARGLAKSLPAVLARLGGALRVQRVSVLPLESIELLQARDPALAWSRAGGMAPGVLADPLRLRSELPRWLRQAARGQCLFGRTGDFPADERACVAAGGVRALAVFPVCVDERLWGLLGCEDLLEERIWQKGELDVLHAVAGLVGRAVERARSSRVPGHAALPASTARPEDAAQAAALMRELAYRASHDALTGLLNRDEFDRVLQRLCDDALESGASHALCYVDLDQFKLVNDSCGHGAGDALLKEIAAALAIALPDEAVLARLGGDEFGVLLPRHSPEAAAAQAQALVAAVARVRFCWGERQFALGASIGVAPVLGRLPGRESVLVAADAACHVAKERGRNRVHVVRPGDVELARRQGEMRWVPRLQTALELDDFVMQAQEIVPTVHGAHTGRHLEVLIALCGADGRSIAPGEFLPAAQRYGLMGRIDRWVLAQVVDWLQRRERRAARPLELVAVNLSGSTLSDPEFREFAEEQVRLLRTPATLCFEITESEAVANLAEATEFIRCMKAFGCRFALDDFGSGLSSFAWLKRLPVDFIKIDGQFVRDMANDPVNHAMVESVHRIGKVMGVRTVAEFVEDVHIFEAVRAVGVDYCQGFHFGRPQPLSDFD